MSFATSLPVFGQLFVLAGVCVLFAHVKVFASSVLLHHATHGELHRDPRWNRLLGEIAGILTLSLPFADYRRIHLGGHHRPDSFADPRTDVEARFLHDEGFRAGVPARRLWRRFLLKQVSPWFHARMAFVRLQANFATGPAGRRLAAVLVWFGAGSIAAATGWLPGFVLGVLAPLLVAGNLGAFWELCSRHRWAIATASMGENRQFELSHNRLPLPAWSEGMSAQGTLRFAGSIAARLLSRLAVVPGDLVHHLEHHLGLDRRTRDHGPLWSDTTAAYAERLRTDARLAAQSFTSVSAAIDAWFRALEREPVRPRRP
jgi:fatty acid desaturase